MTFIRIMSSHSIQIKNEDIDNYIQHMLVKKISRELSYKKFGILGEADLQTVVHGHLKKYLNKDKRKRYKIHNELYLTQSGKSRGVFPDIVIFRTMPHPRIALELKEHKKLQKKYVMEDVKKLFKFKIHHAYLIYLTREENVTGDRLTGRAEEMIGRKYLKKVTPIIINSFDYIKKENVADWKKKWKKYSRLSINKRQMIKKFQKGEKK